MGQPPDLPEYLFFATIETVCTSIIVWQAWTWSDARAAASSQPTIRKQAAAITTS